jgi:hypothetical protein
MLVVTFVVGNLFLRRPASRWKLVSINLELELVQTHAVEAKLEQAMFAIRSSSPRKVVSLLVAIDVGSVSIL